MMYLPTTCDTFDLQLETTITGYEDRFCDSPLVCNNLANYKECKVCNEDVGYGLVESSTVLRVPMC